MILRRVKACVFGGVQLIPFGTAVMALKVIKAPTVKFNNGIEFPIFGLGTWKVSYIVRKNMRIVM
jgi:hypothetical protein